MGVQKYFSAEDRLQIINAIRVAETDTSGEIRVHVENHCLDNVLDRAAYIFGKLEMHKTWDRNGILFYLAVKDRKFAILGDVGIHEKVPENFWEEITGEALTKFKENKFAEGLAEGIIKAGKQLREHFPFEKGDVNELSDEISFGEQ